MKRFMALLAVLPMVMGCGGSDKEYAAVKPEATPAAPEVVDSPAAVVDAAKGAVNADQVKAMTQVGETARAAKEENPIIDPTLHNITVADYVVMPKDPNLDPTVSKTHKSNDPDPDPDFNVYQTWQQAKAKACKDLEGAIAMVEDTINTSPDLAGDAYLVMAQCIDYSMEIPLYERFQKELPLQLTKSEVAARFDRETVFYGRAIEAYQKPGARSLLGITRDPKEQVRKIRDTIMEDKKKIKAWWLDRFDNYRSKEQQDL